MAEEDKLSIMDVTPMNGGDGQYSYKRNSYWQKSMIDSLKELTKKAILEKLDIKNDSSLRVLRIADLGCSVGPDTFYAMQNIVDAVNAKYQILGLDTHTIDFHIFFNDLVSNDFNTLFASLPPQHQYYASGVPGSFHRRLFPNSSLHIVHSSLSIHWLSKVPEQVLDKHSDAWNKGRIHYLNAPDPVINAFAAQYNEDINNFLDFRAEEVVKGGLMALTMPAIPNGSPHSKSRLNLFFDILGSCIMDLVRKGVVDEDKANTFNIPLYIVTADEFVEIVDKNGCFSIDEIKEFSPDGLGPAVTSEKIWLTVRATTENALKKQFGESIIDEIYSLFMEKLDETPSIMESYYARILFALLKRN